MGIRTGKIVYNVRERGRKLTGKDRNFDTVALARMINGPQVQERVKNRDLLGYYGHWPRVKFGMNVTEGAILDGKPVALEPAIVTTSVKADPDGTIEHEVEFLDTNTGRLASRLYQSKAGGLSSAIDTRRVGDKLIPTGFYGFDFVFEPNYTTNRGYVLDSVGDLDSESLSVLDEVGEYNRTLDAANMLLDSMQQQYDAMAAALERSELEREELMSMLVRKGGVAEVALDGVRPDLVGGGEHALDRADEFLAARLPEYEKPASREPNQDPAVADYNLRRWGR